jgi:16S rRNA (uracil1498-N3)-methyltransferase
MNLILLTASDMLSTDTARLSGRHYEHATKTLKCKVGDQLCVGIENGKIGTGRILTVSSAEIAIHVDWHSSAPASLPLKLVIGLPRPKMLRRIIQTATTMGVKDLVFINSWKVEKSYWQSPWLSEPALLDNMRLGLEQAKDTMLPNIQLKPLFKPFVEDELSLFSADSKRLLAHPGTSTPCPVGLNKLCTLVIGPEGGFTPYEVDKLEEQGFEAVHLGPRILRVETAVPSLIARLYTNLG